MSSSPKTAAGRATAARSRRPWMSLLLAALLVVLATAGCSQSQQPERTAVDLQTAKTTTMANERELIAVIAPEDIADVKQNETSSLLGCSDGGHLWTGQIYVTLAPGVDGPGYMQKIMDTWAAKDGWNVKERTTDQGQRVADITNEAGYNHGLDYSAKSNAIRVMSFSPCFTMDPPYQVGTKY